MTRLIFLPVVFLCGCASQPTCQGMKVSEEIERPESVIKAICANSEMINGGCIKPQPDGTVRVFYNQGERDEIMRTICVLPFNP